MDILHLQQLSTSHSEKGRSRPGLFALHAPQSGSLVALGLRVGCLVGMSRLCVSTFSGISVSPQCLAALRFGEEWMVGPRGQQLFFSFFFRATPAAYGSSRARSGTCLCHSPTASWALSCICELHRSSWQCQIFNPLSKARDQTHILYWVLNLLSHNGNSQDS